MEVNAATAGNPTLPVTQSPDYILPDCDTGISVPIPPGGVIEGVTGYQCSNADCHLLIYDAGAHKLYELFAADITNNVLSSSCLVTWQLNAAYGTSRRGLQCTTTDTAGLPLAPLLFDADEVTAGQINHAIRFLLPAARIRTGTFVSPATHGGGANGPASAPPIGARLRLRADYPLASLPSDAARVVARAMQKYGIVLTDAGNVALTARGDHFTTAKWSTLLTSTSLASLQVTDFQMVDGGARIAFTGDCVRAPTPSPSVPVPRSARIALALALVGTAVWYQRRRRGAVPR
jgi:serine/threonine-protein kinase